MTMLTFTEHPPICAGVGELTGLSEQVAKQAVEFFKLLADETRLRIVFVLKQRGELNVQTICRILELTQPAVSHHLALLRVAGLIGLRRAGKHNFYHLVPERFAETASVLQHFMPDKDLMGDKAELYSAE